MASAAARVHQRSTGIVVPEGSDIAMGVQLAVVTDPRRAPAEARDPEALQALGEGPQVGERERIRGPGDVVLAHRSR